MKLGEVASDNIKMGDSSNVKCNGGGTVVVQLIIHYESVISTLKNVLFVPILLYNLLSVSVMARLGLRVAFENNMCSVVQNDKWMSHGSLREIHYYLNTANMQTHCDSEVAENAGLKCWREQLGYAHTEAVQNMYRHRVVGGIEIGFNNVSEKFFSYIPGKSSGVPIPKSSETRSNLVMLSVLTDVFMQSKPSMGGSRYFVFFLIIILGTAGFI